MNKLFYRNNLRLFPPHGDSLSRKFGTFYRIIDIINKVFRWISSHQKEFFSTLRLLDGLLWWDKIDAKLVFDFETFLVKSRNQLTATKA